MLLLLLENKKPRCQPLTLQMKGGAWILDLSGHLAVGHIEHWMSVDLDQVKIKTIFVAQKNYKNPS